MRKLLARTAIILGVIVLSAFWFVFFSPRKGEIPPSGHSL